MKIKMLNLYKNSKKPFLFLLFLFSTIISTISYTNPVKAREYNAKCPNGAFVKDIIAKKASGKLGIRCYKSNQNGITSSTNDDRFWTRYFARNVSSNRYYQDAICPEGTFVSEIIYSDVKDHWGVRCREITMGSSLANWSQASWTQTFLNTTSNETTWTTCPSNSVVAGFVLRGNNLSLHCRKPYVNRKLTEFNEGYWTRYFAN